MATENSASSSLVSEPQASSSGQAAASPSNLRQRKKSAARRPTTQFSFRVHEPKPEHVTDAHERVFLNMYVRKMQRRIWGTKNNDGFYICCEFLIVLLLAALIIYFGWDDDKSVEHEWQDSDTYGVIILVAYTFLVFIIASYLGDSPYAGMLRYMGVYIPLLCVIAGQSFHEEVRQEKITFMELPLAGSYWMWFIFAVLEVLALTGFMSYYHLFPMFMQSTWVRENPGVVAKIWQVGIIQDWTMRYRGHNPRHGIERCCQLHYTCKYHGNTDPNTGLPDGLGRWLDDAREGETLTGYWNQGFPVAPFSSWNVGTDDAISAVRVAYFKATDDKNDRNNFFPSNECPPTTGVASVECSVSGSFYNHLPHATLIIGPLVVDSMPSRQDNPVREVLGHLFFQIAEAGEDSTSSISIQAIDPRGVQVHGHVCQKTGSFYSPNTKQIKVDIDWGNGEDEGAHAMNQTPLGNAKPSQPESARYLQKTLFMPNSSISSRALVEVAIDDSSEEEDSNGVVDSSEDTELQHDAQFPLVVTEKQNLKKNECATLRVQGWIPYKYKEALVFCPGYNSCLEDNLKNFGQFLSMTKLSRHVYPFVYQWPGSRNVGYAYASRISATDTNQQNMLKLVKGLEAAGVERIHFMSHSMGVQTLLGAFRDKYDEHGTLIGRSDVSMCFQLDPKFSDSTVSECKRMVCKSITLLNADFPVRAFVDRAYLSIRRVCQTITVVGDRNDRALFWSSFFNGVAPKFGYKYPEVLRPSISPFEQNLALMERMGCSIEKLYFSPSVGQQCHNNGNADKFRHQLFNKAFVDISGKAGTADSENRFWLDMDVIDMTGLDTNIKGMRHSGFSLNGMLLKDLEELISSGKRAMKRTTLLYREGNVFTYAHAPAFVSQ